MYYNSPSLWYFVFTCNINQFSSPSYQINYRVPLYHKTLIVRYNFYFYRLKIMSLNCDAKKEKNTILKEISFKICTKQGVHLRIRCGNGSPESLGTAVWGRQFQSTVVRGENEAFFCCVLHTETWYDREYMFLECLEGGESLTFTDCNLVMLDFIHHDKACISSSIFEAAPFKM